MNSLFIWNLSLNELILILTLIITILIHFHIVRKERKREKFNRFNQISQRLLDTGHSIKDFEKKDCGILLY
jgi:hypothetical protein